MDVCQPAPEAAERGRSVAQVIDMAHLARQTMDDEQVQREVLPLFMEQARRCIEELEQADAALCKAVAHRLLGAARGIGAIAVAEAAQALEGNPSNEIYFATVRAAVEEAERLIRELCA